MSDHFASAKRRLTRTGQHLARLRIVAENYRKSPCYQQVRDLDPGTRDTLHKIKAVILPPAELTDLVVEIGEGLRAALDLAGSAASSAAGVSNVKSAYFPFGRTEVDLDAAIRGKCKDLPPGIAEHFRSFRPYESGNALLWGLSQLSGATKHVIVEPVATGVGGVFYNNLSVQNAGAFAIPTPQWNPSTHDVILFRYSNPDAVVEFEISVAMELVFGAVPGLQRQAVVAVMERLHNDVAYVVTSTETLCRGMGLVR